tara:strand:- start:301 stop:873 length:573 start_codon:yes stop_codon:yes gene_type:complete
MKQLARIIKECGHRGKVGHIYEVIEKNPRDGFRLVKPGQTTYTFWYPVDCVEEVELGACTIPSNFGVPLNIDKWTESLKTLEETTTGLDLEDIKKKARWKVPKDADFAWHLDKVAKSITDLLKEKNAAYGNTALNPLGIFSKLGAAEAIKARIDDKLARISNKGLNDDTEDTARDLVGYLLLLLMAIDKD